MGSFLRSETVKKLYKISKYVFFPLLLVLFCLIKVNKGVDLTDASYSLGNARFFDVHKGTWFILTFLANGIGHVFTLLPYGNTMIGMKVYTSLIIALMSITGYRFFLTKIPAWLSFLSQLAVIGLCWIPSTILYNYLTYLFLLLASVFLFRGLAGNRNISLVIAGFFLGINMFVRFPGNALEVFLILPLIFYCVIHKLGAKEIVRRSLLCIAGYVIGFVLPLTILFFAYGPGIMKDMIEGAGKISESASDYTFASMILSILDAYWHGFKWALYMIICTVLGVPFFLLFEHKFEKLRKVVYCLCIAFLFFVLGRWGMYNFKYFQKESALQWGAIFLLISIAFNIWMLLTKRINDDWRLLGAISLVLILITPLGSNNYIWPVLNNLFFIAPITFWEVYRFTRWGRSYFDMTHKVPLFAAKAMLAACCIAFFIQALGVGAFYIFLDGENGEELKYEITDNDVLKGMKTNPYTAYNLSGLSKYFKDNEDTFKERKLILYGNIPGVSYYLDKDTAINTTWSDLDSDPVEDLEEALIKAKELKDSERPIVILGNTYEDDTSVNEKAKRELINKYIYENSYSETYVNEMFTVYE